MSIRYLTHETEDKFWVNKGAKPHPLAKKEEQESTLRRASVTSSPKAPSKRENFSKHSSQPSKESLPTADPSSPSDEEEDGVELSPPTPPIVLPPKDSSFKITVEDPIVVKREEHARRIGYTVSTV